MNNSPDQAHLLPILQTKVLGQRMIYETSIPSSNRTVLELAEAGEKEGLLVVAESQTAGRGRNTRTWFSPPNKNLYFSLLLHPSLPPARIPELALLLAIGLRRGILQIAPELPISLKWPNDLWIGKYKISGILCESRSTPAGLVLAAGIGLNVNCAKEEFPQELRETASSLEIATGKKLDRPALLAAILKQLEECYIQWQNSDSLAPFLAEWDAADLLKGRLITIEQPTGIISGTACGIAPDGRLKFQPENSPLRLISCGDTSLHSTLSL